MNLIFSLENDDEIDVISEPIEEMEPQVDVTQEITDLLNTYNNLLFVRKHIKKFGITREFLHLVNTDNNLGTAIGLMLPYYENDSEVSDIDESELSNTEVIIEGLGDQIKKIADKIKEKFNSLGDFFKQKVTKLLNTFKTLEGEMTDVKKAASSSKNTYDKDALKQISLSAIPKKQLDVQWSAVSTALRSSSALAIKIGKVKGDPIFDFMVPRKTINEGLKYIGKNIEADANIRYTLNKIGERDYKIKENSNAYDLGYDKTFFIAFCGNGKYVKDIQAYIKDTQEIINDGRKVALSLLDEKEDVLDIELLNNNFKIVFSCYEDLIQEMIFYIRNVITLSKHFNF